MEDFTSFISANPQYGYLIGAAVMLVLIIGLILDWDWILEPGGGYFNIAYWIETFGRKTIRIAYGAVFLIGMLAFLYGYYSYNPELYPK